MSDGSGRISCGWLGVVDGLALHGKQTSAASTGDWVFFNSEKQHVSALYYLYDLPVLGIYCLCFFLFLNFMSIGSCKCSLGALFV